MISTYSVHTHTDRLTRPRPQVHGSTPFLPKSSSDLAVNNTSLLSLSFPSQLTPPPRPNNTRPRQSKPTPSFIPSPQPETPIPILQSRQRLRNPAIPIPSSHPLSQHQLFPPTPLLNQLPRNNPKHLLDTLSILGRNLMTTIPPDILPPEPTRSLRVRRMKRRR